MFIIEITLSGTPATLTIQKKTAEDAEGVFKQIVEGMRASSVHLLELTCDHQVGKRVAVFSNVVCAVQMYEKTGGGASGRTPGFFAMADS